ncbi:hypothetical protein GW17_00002122 [Ensete ventricosum]|nr:hypothetical protein GW17_00002122 [Ensete ventricosum]
MDLVHSHHRRRSLLFFLLLLFFFFFLSACPGSRAEVITLTEETFSDKVLFDLLSSISICLLATHVKEKDTIWFVQFCVPWCKHW